MKPSEMLNDQRLSHCDHFIFEVLVCGKSNSRPWVEIGERLAAQLARTDRRIFRRARNRLVKCGWLEWRRNAVGRSEYRPTADLFHVPGVGAPQEAEAWGSVAPPLKECPRCHEQVRQILRAGYCRPCAAEVKLRIEIDKKLDERGVKLKAKPRRKAAIA